jgi:DNA helicase-2/ATP-dependent DNA helicase PcrA
MSRLSVQLFAFNAAIAKELRDRIERMALPASDPRHLAPLSRPSPYQTAIFDFVAGGRGSAIVKAVAGSGKTTTIVQALRVIPGVDLGQVRASTFHSVGFGAICKYLNRGPKDFKIDGGKVKRLLRENLGDVEYEMYGAFVSRLVGLAKGDGIGAIAPDVEDAWYELSQHHDLYLDSEEADERRAVALAREFLTKSNDAAKAADIDFDDQLYLPLLWKLRLWQNDYVIIDEAQDTNPVRRALAKLALRPGGRLIAVGDHRQAIYGFTGASHDAMDLIQSEFSCCELPLTVSYRCPATVGRLVRDLVDYFETAPGAPEGTVSHVTLADALTRLDSHDAILCRNTAPLIDAAFTLIGKGIGCVVLGKDIGAALSALVKKQKAQGVDALIKKLESYRDREVSKHTARGEEQKAEAVVDRVECVLTVIDHLPEDRRTVPALLERLDSMFSDSNGVITLSTVHKAKGREWPKVAILRPDLMPSRWARQEWQQLQEINLQYVSWSRPTEELMFITDEELQ